MVDYRHFKVGDKVEWFQGTAQRHITNGVVVAVDTKRNNIRVSYYNILFSWNREGVPFSGASATHDMCWRLIEQDPIEVY